MRNCRLSESPESIRLGNTMMEFDDPRAIAFAIIGKSVVYSASQTHPTIFNAVARKWSAKKMAANGVSAKPPLTDADRDYFEEVYSGVMGTMRLNTHSGRAWKNVKVDGKLVSAVSFWSAKAQTPPDAVNKVIAALGLDTKAEIVFVEYIDSRKPFLWGNSEGLSKKNTKALISRKYPKLTSDEIVNILVKSHTSGRASLSKMERDVVDEFRGSPAASAGKKPAKGFKSGAEQTFYSRMGDSVKTVKWADLILDNRHSR